ncbi:Fc receptor, IgE, high affinity I, gamma polypeptide like isoform X2 [Lampris incognitus]|uniref:Fc receptor, IgE, high affinity I, gamma polypeptide like isoform X2 n=1 Tax=Lampris incognitus TaxID=2546036 RepID=UPI0024B4BDF1|nr:Fc receptor, IgE, high affinity I, gamma polypeptide like isoform X2 [Lampris incognitus]
MMRGALVTIFILLNLSLTEALDDFKICYILDGILLFYGVVLTILYCRLRIYSTNICHAESTKHIYEKGIYAGLNPHQIDTYETIKIKHQIV